MKKTYTLESHALASLYDFFLSKRWFSVQLMVDENLMLALYRKEHFETLTNTFSLIYIDFSFNDSNLCNF
jgi:hypothetical protein